MRDVIRPPSRCTFKIAHQRHKIPIGYPLLTKYIQTVYWETQDR